MRSKKRERNGRSHVSLHNLFLHLTLISPSTFVRTKWGWIVNGVNMIWVIMFRLGLEGESFGFRIYRFGWRCKFGVLGLGFWVIFWACNLGVWGLYIWVKLCNSGFWVLGFGFNFQANDLRLCNLIISLSEGAWFGVLNVKVNLWVCYLGIWVKLHDFKWFRHVIWAF